MAPASSGPGRGAARASDQAAVGDACDAVVRVLAGLGARCVRLDVDAAGLDRSHLAERLREVAVAADSGPADGSDPAPAGADGAGARGAGPAGGRGASDSGAPEPAGSGLGGVVSLFGWDETPHPTAPEASRGLAGTLLLVQAMADAELTAPLWLTTRGAVAVDGDDAPPTPAQAAVWRLGRVVAHEHPRLWGGLADLPAAGSLDGLGTALTCGEDEVAVRGADVFVPRLVRAAPAPATPRGASGPATGWHGPGRRGGRLGDLCRRPLGGGRRRRPGTPGHLAGRRSRGGPGHGRRRARYARRAGRRRCAARARGGLGHRRADHRAR